ncbi:MAG: proton-conducting transporter membrane subunit [Desulfobacterales bacterium]
MTVYLCGIGAIVLGGVLAVFAGETAKAKILSLCTGIGSILVIYPAIAVLAGSEAPEFLMQMSEPFGTVRLMMDRLSAFFAIVIAFMSFLGTLYAVGYMQHYCNRGKDLGSHFLFFSILIASMLLTVTVQHGLAFLIVWEIMSLSSFFLVTFEQEKEEVCKAGLNYLISMHIGAVFLTAGFIVLANASGSFDFSAFRTVINSGTLSVFAVFLLFFMGFGMKAGFVPLHTWLPQAHPAAPSHISGIMSGIMIKTGIYGILRIVSMLDSPSPKLGFFVLIVSLLSGLLGVACAIAQHNLKKLLAYHSVENIGIIGMGIGVGMLGLSYKNSAMAVLGFSGALLHVLNHSIFKSLLFYAAGMVYQKTHTMEIEKLGGLAKSMRFTAIAFLIGAAAISGLPPLNGFISEFFIYWGMFKGLKGGIFPAVVLVISISGLAFVGAMALLCFTKAFGVVFQGSPRSRYPEESFETGLFFKIPMIAECAMIVLIGLFPAQVFSLICTVTSQFADISGYPMTEALTVLNSLSKGFLLFLLTAVLVWMLRSRLRSRKGVSHCKTWDCGYQAGNVRMQYTASSYADPFVRIIRPVLDYQEHFRLPVRHTADNKKDFLLFPEAAGFESHTKDKMESCVIEPVISLLSRFLHLFSWIQSGNIRVYILYGLIFLAAITVWTMGVQR